LQAVARVWGPNSLRSLPRSSQWRGE
jgi:hypothetical protein